MSKENPAEKAKVVKEEKTKEQSVKITSEEIQVVSKEFHNFGNTNVIFEKDKPVLLTGKVLDQLLEMPNFKDLVDKGVIKIGV